jgi:hypothetical protein
MGGGGYYCFFKNTESFLWSQKEKSEDSKGERDSSKGMEISPLVKWRGHMART